MQRTTHRPRTRRTTALGRRREYHDDTGATLTARGSDRGQSRHQCSIEISSAASPLWGITKLMTLHNASGWRTESGIMWSRGCPVSMHLAVFVINLAHDVVVMPRMRRDKYIFRWYRIPQQLAGRQATAAELGSPLLRAHLTVAERSPYFVGSRLSMKLHRTSGGQHNWVSSALAENCHCGFLKSCGTPIGKGASDRSPVVNLGVPRHGARRYRSKAYFNSRGERCEGERLARPQAGYDGWAAFGDINCTENGRSIRRVPD